MRLSVAGCRAARNWRLILAPLRIEHAEETVLVLGDRSLYAYTAGEPPDLDASGSDLVERTRAIFERIARGRY